MFQKLTRECHDVVFTLSLRHAEQLIPLAGRKLGERGIVEGEERPLHLLAVQSLDVVAALVQNREKLKTEERII